jgi:hypothetical protein
MTFPALLEVVVLGMLAFMAWLVRLVKSSLVWGGTSRMSLSGWSALSKLNLGAGMGGGINSTFVWRIAAW